MQRKNDGTGLHRGHGVGVSHTCGSTEQWWVGGGILEGGWEGQFSGHNKEECNQNTKCITACFGMFAVDALRHCGRGPGTDLA